MPSKKLNFDDVREIAMKLGGFEDGAIRGAPSLKAGGKLLVCPALHKSADPDSWVVRISPCRRSELISAEPNTYYLTNHYANYPMVLVRLSQLDRDSLQVLLETSLRFSNAKTKTTINRPPPSSATRKKK